jgi:hypothetical protein
MIKNLIEVNKNGGNSPTPIFAEMNAAPKAKFINRTKKISLVFNWIGPYI